MYEIEQRQERALELVRGLSPRQRQVLHGLVDGMMAKQIARQLDLSPRTVEIHRAILLRKLGVQSSNEAVAIGALAGFGICEFLD